MPPTVPQRGGPSRGKQRPGAVSGKTVLGGKRHRKIRKDTIRGITKPDIRRLARRGGVKRISATIYDDVRQALAARLREILGRCVIYTEHRQAKTITVNDVIFSLRSIGRPIYGFDPDTYKHNPKKQTESSQ
ncbi:histone-fold-containing protein [Phialemonium atrogriseum]|uniref:Histone H4 n=1 Tax=Phialemonium atrogriseum TaxID=1093897 RepID=A0AAJ0C711_9PEZI|nr:histone-fold-containing protein [Phialemonium atrogriseum]KAK1771320.1 histone-fold-containing protein [Phialemonium atrogriseum]